MSFKNKTNVQMLFTKKYIYIFFPENINSLQFVPR